MWPKWHAPRTARIYHLSRFFTTLVERTEKQSVYNGEGQAAKFDRWCRRTNESFSWSPIPLDKSNFEVGMRSPHIGMAIVFKVELWST